MSQAASPAVSDSEATRPAEARGERVLTGRVVSDKMDKTIVVTVHSYKTHSKYHKKYRVSKKYYAHDPEKQFKIGDEVTIYETRPLSKLKRLTVVQPSNTPAK